LLDERAGTFEAARRRANTRAELPRVLGQGTVTKPNKG
jgi:hypothetical protein